jgi:hypothetical protein
MKLALPMCYPLADTVRHSSNAERGQATARSTFRSVMGQQIIITQSLPLTKKICVMPLYQ